MLSVKRRVIALVIKVNNVAVVHAVVVAQYNATALAAGVTQRLEIIISRAVHVAGGG